MRRSVYAAVVAGIAMLLSVALAAPAAAAGDPWWDYIKNPNAPQYKYSFDYYKRAFRPTPGGGGTQVPTGTKLPVPPTVNPSTSGPAWYLNNYRNRTTAPNSPALSGKVITPGQTVVRVPSTYGLGGASATSSATLSKALGALRLGAFVGAGIGGTSVAPSNSKEIALAKGVSQACIDGTATCTRDEINKQFLIGSCGQLTGANSCDSIGAKGPNGETASADWFKDEALPFLEDLWAQITGQKGNKDPLPTSEFYDVTMARGCYRTFAVEYRGDSNITLHQRSEIVAARPTGPEPNNQGTYWDYECGAAALSSFNPSHSTIKTTCIDQDGNSANPAGGTAYGVSQSMGYLTDSNTGMNKVGMCNTAPNVGKTLTLFRVRIGNTDNQAYYATAKSLTYSAIKYTEWINPDPLNTIEGTKITTSWDCRMSDGVLYTFTKTVVSTAAAVSPSCPVGSDLVRHDISTSEGGTNAKTYVDVGGEIPSEVAKYPNCFKGPGCTMDVWVDGTVCVVGRADCLNWPALSARTPSRVVCKWGAYVVPTSDCRAISNGYKTETGVIFDPRSGSWPAVDDYGNPADMNPEPWNPTNPNPTPGTPPSTGTGTGTTPAPAPSTPGFPTTGTAPADGCVSPAWSWNPVDWVKNPVVCALKEAFVPKTDVQARSDALKAKAVTTAPIGWVIDPPIVAPSGGGCPNWVINVDGLSKNVVCESSFTGAIVGVRGPMFGIVATAMMWPLLRSIWYALIPIVRVTPSGSK